MLEGFQGSASARLVISKELEQKAVGQPLRTVSDFRRNKLFGLEKCVAEQQAGSHLNQMKSDGYR